MLKIHIIIAHEEKKHKIRYYCCFFSVPTEETKGARTTQKTHKP